MILTDALLLDFKRCQRRAYLNHYGNQGDRDLERDFLLKLRQESQRHITEVLQQFYPHHETLTRDRILAENNCEATLELMAQGIDCIHQGTIAHLYDYGTGSVMLQGNPHLLVKRSGQSHWGDWYYMPVSIQLGRRPKPEYKIIATFYAYLLQQIQGTLPPFAQIVLRRQNHYAVITEEWLPRLESLLQEFTLTLCHAQEPEVFISRQRCSLCAWYRHCYGIAQDRGHLSLVPGVTPHRYESLQAIGIVTVESLATSPTQAIKEVMGLEMATTLQRQAQSILENCALRRSPKVLPIPSAEIELYFDIEAEPERNLDYLLGIILRDRRRPKLEFTAFLAEKPEDEGKIWQEFLEFVERYPQAPIFHYSEYEVETLKRLAHLYRTPRRQLDRLLRRTVDLHQRVTTAVFCPVESYSLKAIAQWLGFSWRDIGASGDQCVCWYDRWLTTGDRDYLAAILRYNEDDCLATLHLKDWLVEFLEESPAGKIP
jgi:predicted RecB family nuclease